jgi:SAM-dependent methyltransferase
MPSRCYCCDSTEFKSFLPYRTVPSDNFLFANCEVVRCTKCQLLQINRSFTDQEIQEYYEKHYDRDKIYSLNNDIFPADNLWSVSRGRALAKLYAKTVPASPELVMDVGCGYGYVLWGFHQHFPQARYVGVDYDAAAGKNLKSFGAEFIQGGVSDCAHLAGTASVLITSHVYEHVIHPHDFLEQCKTLLRPGGCLLWEVPNLDEHNSRCEKRHSPHVCFWEQHSLTAILEKHQFEILFFQTAGKKYRWFDELPRNGLSKLAARIYGKVYSENALTPDGLTDKNRIGHHFDEYGPGRRNLRFIARRN